MASVKRTTKETDIQVTLNLDGTGICRADTGIGFFDHMLTALAVHSGMDLTVRAKGDLEVDCHHTVEDVGIVLGKALAQALGDKGGIARYGSAHIPMDEALAFSVLDISGRPYLVFSAPLKNERVGAFDTCMTEEFFRALCMNAGITLHLQVLYGANDHHMIEAAFKAFAHSLRQAAAPMEKGKILSSKGIL
ncbi:MAG TPA: imidazoleglycerol-phosphate dehydratase HisB [Ruminococcaceae bacterium]|nr:imidazoleglycerol-phosphate dehydratase HisB [Oscillospiraceae bacterium]